MTDKTSPANEPSSDEISMRLVNDLPAPQTLKQLEKRKKPAKKANPAPPSEKPSRLQSLDAYRGLVMLAIASSGLGITSAAKSYPNSEIWQTLSFNFEHFDWIGCGFWDLIQPSFMFMVGVSMAYSYVKRSDRGDSYFSMFLHALTRSIILVALGVFLASGGRSQANFVFTNVLAQIGLGYLFLFLLWRKPVLLQFAAIVVLLGGYWGWFAMTPLPAKDFDYSTVGLQEDWPRLDGFNAHWEKNVNAAAKFDVWFLNLLPSKEVFKFNSGGYQTLSFIPSLATMIFGLMAGGLMRSNRRALMKLLILIASGAACVGIGFGLGELGVCPVVKRIWTPTWAVYSAGWCFLILAGFYLMVDIIGSRKLGSPLRWLAFPLTVVGVNSIAMYMMSQLIKGWTRRSLDTHLGENYPHDLLEWLATRWGNLQQLSGLDSVENFANTFAPMLEAIAIVTVLWLICYWLYKQKSFLRI